VVLGLRDEYLVALLQRVLLEAARDEVERLGRAAAEDYLSRLCGVDELGDFRARALEDFGRLLTQRVPLLDARVLVRVQLAQPLNHLSRLLARGRVVEVDERLSINLPLEYGEVFPYAYHV
jgi:hypothetical protein